MVGRVGGGRWSFEWAAVPRTTDSFARGAVGGPDLSCVEVDAIEAFSFTILPGDSLPPCHHPNLVKNLQNIDSSKTI